jgi:VWA domain-containing protein
MTSIQYSWSGLWRSLDAPAASTLVGCSLGERRATSRWQFAVRTVSHQTKLNSCPQFISAPVSESKQCERPVKTFDCVYICFMTSYLARCLFVPVFLVACALVCTITVEAQYPPSPDASNHSGSQSASVVIVIDASSDAKSMAKTLKKAAVNFAEKFPSDYELAVFASQDQPKLVQSFTSDNSLIIKSVDNLRASGKLASYQAMDQALQYAHSDAVNDKQAVVAFVNKLDGPDMGAIRALQNTIREAQPVPLYFIALGHSSWQWQESAERVAVLSGGAAYFPTNESDLSAVSQAIAQRLGAASENASAQTAQQSLHDYKTLIVRSIPVADNGKTAQFPAGDNLLLERLLTLRLQKTNLFRTVIDAPDPSLDRAGVSPSAGSNLELLATIIGHDRGHPGTPFGPTRMKVQVVLRDLATRQPIAAFTRQQAGPSGMFRGSQEKVEAGILLSLADKIVDALKSMKKH